jgi:low temperature requirement protein LtrA
MHSVWVALGLFVTLWWTWVGFAVLYNRLGADVPGQRLLFLAASVPVGVAAAACLSVEPSRINLTSSRRPAGPSLALA